MEKKIRVGIMGCASIAKRSLAPAFLAHPAFELVAVASRMPDKAANFVRSLNPQPSNLNPPTSNFKLPSTCNLKLQTHTYESLVEFPDIDLIYCPLPTGLHYEWVKKALEAGKHVLCEKSLACNQVEVEDLVATARARQRFLMESFQFRFHAQNLYVKELLSKNAIGELRQLLVRFGIPPFPEGAKNIRYSAELGGGALLDNGAYTVKCATYLLGPDVRVLAATEGGATPVLGNVPLTGSIMMAANLQHSTSNLQPQTSDLKLQTISVQTSYGFDHFYQNSYEIWGTEGMISTTRAFTAREDFAAPVILETKAGKEVKTFNDDHFARLLDYVAQMIHAGDYEIEYNECLVQAKLVSEVASCSKMTGLNE